MPLPPLLFADDALLAFAKPAGLPVVPEGRAGAGGAALLPQVREVYGAGVMAAHRLETETSGVLVCARTKPALDFVSGQFQAKTAIRVLHALVVVWPVAGPADLAAVGGGRAEVAEPGGAVGPRVVMPVREADGSVPEAFEVTLGLDDDHTRPGALHVFKKKGGRTARTAVRTLERFGRFAWLECRPDEARLHQVGAHLAAVGLPLLNDVRHGAPEVKLWLSDLKRGYKGKAEEKPLLERLGLHTSEVTVRHPDSREAITIVAPWPAEFEIALKYLRKFARGR